eukprot:2265052-Prorocentrum_lima.AAC.1
MPLTVEPVGGQRPAANGSRSRFERSPIPLTQRAARPHREWRGCCNWRYWSGRPPHRWSSRTADV